MSFAFEKTPHNSLSCKPAPVQSREKGVWSIQNRLPSGQFLSTSFHSVSVWTIKTRNLTYLVPNYSSRSKKTELSVISQICRKTKGACHSRFYRTAFYLTAQMNIIVFYRKSCVTNMRDVQKMNCPNNVSMSTSKPPRLIHPRFAFFLIIFFLLQMYWFFRLKCNFPCNLPSHFQVCVLYHLYFL